MRKAPRKGSRRPGTNFQVSSLGKLNAQPLILPEMMWGNTYRVLSARETHLRLHVQGFLWRSALQVWSTHMADLGYCFQLLQRSNHPCGVPGPHQKPVSINHLMWLTAPSKHRHSHEAGYSKGWKVISQELVKGQTYLWNVQDLSKPELPSQACMHRKPLLVPGP